ncbi:organic hydroperoxide reductase OsmC/OhrA [Prauserella isguenensis]|uniref:Organic hydroperoxide reductase OsmC/OhrA n=1 Tax=Prauserella isguenensis TaxID=1470180 RepID=A0A839RYF5_9PSEU|nr:OsmC family protein [Prauserella isguenensis]MBB3050143.1 organic hydroperoxide reductase OsmC/OhrA [Prauserella isguenensis]
MREREHTYRLTLRWTGDRGTGTSGYRDFGREHHVVADGKPPLAGSADPFFRGDADRWNPEELLLAALAQCHMLSYLAQCAQAGVVVTGYADEPLGTMTETLGVGEFTSVSLRPVVTVADTDMVDKARELHEPAHEACFIARSVNFPVRHEARIDVDGDRGGSEGD